ncbi:MAG: ABC transporter substrate-binding protein [Deltaproteobacteria bacterium]|nr:ABC transporter substrate-binding protein [Deltaproteobacteria bacterium]
MKKEVVLFKMLITALTSFIMATSLMAVPKDEVRVALMFEPSTVNVLELKTGIDISVVLNMHDSLMTSDPKTGERTLKDSLSESIEVMPDQKSIKIKLRKNAVFHTGDPLTAHDVKFTYDQVVNPKNGNLMASMYDEIEEIEVLNDYNLIFHMYESYAPWRELMWMGIASKKYFEKVGREKFRKHPVGSGPFKFVKRRFGEYVELEAFEKHPLFQVDFKTLRLMVIPDDVTRLAMLETGELDVVSDILPHHLKRLKRNKHVVIKKEPTYPSLYGLACRANNYKICGDGNFSKALSHAINRQEIVDRVFLGEGYPLYMYASKSELGYDPKVVYEYDLEKAKQYLRKSSYKPGDPITLTYTSLVPSSRMIAAMVQRYLTKLGLTMKLQQLEAGVQATYNRNRDPREGHMTLYSWGGGRDPQARLALSIISDSDYSSWSTRPYKKEIDALVKAQGREMNQEKRLKLLSQLHEYLRKPSSGTMLFGSNMVYAHSDRVDYNWAPMDAFIFNLHRIKMVK